MCELSHIKKDSVTSRWEKCTKYKDTVGYLRRLAFARHAEAPSLIRYMLCSENHDHAIAGILQNAASDITHSCQNQAVILSVVKSRVS